MNCAKCQFKMAFQERVCRRCQYCQELDTYISTDAPRRSRNGIQKVRLRTRMLAVLRLESLRFSRQRELSPNLVLAAGIVPGLGHILTGRLYEGLLYAAGVPALLLSALFSRLDASNSLTLMGLAFGLHVTSLFRLTAFSVETGFKGRLAAHLGIFIILSICLYAPLSSLLLSYKPEMTMDRTSGVEHFFGNFSTFVFILAGAWVLGQFLSLVFSLPEKKRT